MPVYKDRRDSAANPVKSVRLDLRVKPGQLVLPAAWDLMAVQVTGVALESRASKVSLVRSACLGLPEILAKQVQVVRRALAVCQEAKELLDQQALQVSSISLISPV